MLYRGFPVIGLVIKSSFQYGFFSVCCVLRCLNCICLKLQSHVVRIAKPFRYSSIDMVPPKALRISLEGAAWIVDGPISLLAKMWNVHKFSFRFFVLSKSHDLPQLKLQKLPVRVIKPFLST